MEKSTELLMNDFDWSPIVGSLFVDFSTKLQGYFNKTGVQCHHPLVLMHVLEELQNLFGTFGFNFSPAASDQINSNQGAIIEEAVQFRSKIRSLSLQKVKDGNKDSALEYLKTCDVFRINLSSKGILIEV